MKVRSLGFRSQVGRTGYITALGRPVAAGVPTMTNWKIERTSEKDKPAVYRFLLKSFFFDEPCSRGLFKIHGPPPEDSCLGIQALPQGMSFKAVSMSGDIVGVALNLDHEKLVDFHPVLEEPLKTLYPFFDMIDRECGEDEGYLSLHILAVDHAWRKQGIAGRLVAVSEEESVLRGYKGLRVVCTSAYSAMLMARRGLHMVYSYPYSNYRDSRGAVVLDPPAPHHSVEVYVSRNE